MIDVSGAAARRIALAAQGFDGARRPRPRVDARTVLRGIDDMGLLQMDSVNVLVRAHYIPLYARLGPYRRSLLDELAYERRALFEYWGHEASLIPMAMQPLFRWRMEAAPHPYWVRWVAQHGDLVDRVLDHVKEHGPTTVSDLSEPRPAKGGPWWDWAAGKTALEYLFARGMVTTTSRRHFERVYDLTERVVPPAILNLPTPDAHDAHRELLARAARALGIGTAKDLADYFRIKVTAAKPRLAELAEEGVLQIARVEGWPNPVYLFAGARTPRRVAAGALVSPFDPLVWERSRAERLFGFRYRIEIYTPAHKRVHGYYVLPFLMDEQLAARIDLKADRKASRLLVQAAHAEPGTDRAAVGESVAGELRLMAEWLELDGITVAKRGDLATTVRKNL